MSEQVKSIESTESYLAGGTLEDARGVIRTIVQMTPGGRAQIRIDDLHFDCVDPDHYRYRPPVKLIQMTPSLQEKLNRLADMYRGCPPDAEWNIALHAAMIEWNLTKEQQ